MKAVCWYGIHDVRTENVPDPIMVSPRDMICLLYTSDAADERSSVDLGGRRIIKKKKTTRSARRLTNEKPAIKLLYKFFRGLAH